ncbi:MAG: hypothetical protein RMI56_02445 [Sulfolobales archaeon]|nr:hypothetical protein [Sulfolobales archaeon]
MSIEKCGVVSQEFLDLVIYSIYRAVNEVLGEKTWDIVWRSGEVLYEKLEELLRLHIVEDYVEVLEKLAEWLQKSGYVDVVRIRKLSENEIEYVMGRPAIVRGAEKLVKERMVPPHISTSLMFAALRKRGLKAELAGDPQFLLDGSVVERWKIARL